jgi:hypothetical protein
VIRRRASTHLSREFLESASSTGTTTAAAAGGPALQVAEGIFQTLATAVAASTTDKSTTFALSDSAIALNLANRLRAANCSSGI